MASCSSMLRGCACVRVHPAVGLGPQFGIRGAAEVDGPIAAIPFGLALVEGLPRGRRDLSIAAVLANESLQRGRRHFGDKALALVVDAGERGHLSHYTPSFWEKKLTLGHPAIAVSRMLFLG